MLVEVPPSNRNEYVTRLKRLNSIQVSVQDCQPWFAEGEQPRCKDGVTFNASLRATGLDRPGLIMKVTQVSSSRLKRARRRAGHGRTHSRRRRQCRPTAGGSTCKRRCSCGGHVSPPPPSPAHSPPLALALQLMSECNLDVKSLACNQHWQKTAQHEEVEKLFQITGVVRAFTDVDRDLLNRKMAELEAVRGHPPPPSSVPSPPHPHTRATPPLPLAPPPPPPPALPAHPPFRPGAAVAQKEGIRIGLTETAVDPSFSAFGVSSATQSFGGKLRRTVSEMVPAKSS